MGLYDRNYTNDTSSIDATTEYAAAQDSALVKFVKLTYIFFGASLFFAFVGAVIGFYNLQLVYENRMILFVAEIAALFGLMFSRSKPGLNIAMLFIFTTLTGLVATPLVAMVAAKAGAGAVVMAFAMTTIIFGVMSIFGIRTRKDLASMGKMLFIALIVVRDNSGARRPEYSRFRYRCPISAASLCHTFLPVTPPHAPVPRSRDGVQEPRTPH